MDVDFSLKILGFLGAAIAGSIGTWKVLYELLNRSKTSLREEYRFARDLLSTANVDAMHPALAEMGYQALAGDATVSADEIKHLLTLQNSRTAIRDYIAARQVLEFFSTAPVAKINFGRKYRSSSWRKALKFFYGFTYFLTYTIAFAPLLLISMQLLSAVTGLALFALSATMFLPIAFLAARSGGRIFRAERLVSAQAASKAIWA